ncbi:MAG: peptide-methionine (S)-S-oxide reductase MsrA [Sulfurovum sp.]|nr:MAG: peptide-methionine (S)-S-oxide reductase MsrA [Sulfurovum sp.]
MKELILGGGCFWCLEAVFELLDGVYDVESGYANGEIVYPPTYEIVCSGKSGYAEVVKISYDEDIISFEDLLEVFFEIHDPTTLNAQGADRGTQYRSLIIYQNEEEKSKIDEMIEEIQNNFKDKIVTQVVPLKNFYPAEDYHQNYFSKHPFQGYCSVVISPKVAKAKKLFHLMMSKKF